MSGLAETMQTIGDQDTIQARPLLCGRKIVFVLGDLELGGAERQAIMFADYLRTHAGTCAEVWGFARPGRAAELCDRLGVPWRLCPLPSGLRHRTWWLRAAWKLARELRRQRAEVLLPYYAMPNILCGLGWRLSGARTCIWNQRDVGVCLESRIVPWAVRNTPVFVSNSEVGAEHLVARFGLARDRIQVVRNAVRLPAPVASRDEWRARLRLPPDCFVACMVANVTPLKDHVTLLRAWRIVLDGLSDEKPNPVLLLAGRLDDATPAKALAFDLELGKSVRFLGSVDDISGLLNAVDLGVFSSQLEGCPNGLLECMAAGLAVVASDIPGIREAVGAELTASLAPPGDFEAFAARILKLVYSADLRDKFAAANEERIAREFDPERSWREMARVVANSLAVS